MTSGPGLLLYVTRVFDDYPDVDRRSCRLLGPTGLVVQALMGLLAILSLVYKRQREEPKRPWRIWLFDVSKQVVGQMFVHVVNLLISDVGAHHKSGNACVFYFLNILLDTTFGVAIIYVIHHWLTFFLTERLLLKGFKSGVYGTPPSIKYWARQAAVYVFSLSTMKTVVVAVFAFIPAIFRLGEWLLSWTRFSDTVQVIFTMGIFPIIMNILQFWLIDSIVKASGSAVEVVSPNGSRDVDREPLFATPLDGDDDGDGAPGHDVENPVLPSHLETQLQADDDTTWITGSATALSGSRDASMHAYPPMSISAPSTHSRSSEALRSRSPPPPPLPIHSFRPPALPTLATAPVSQPPRVMKVQRDDNSDSSGQEWASSWEGDDDWVDKAVKEDTNARRIREKVGIESWNSGVRVPIRS